VKKSLAICAAVFSAMWIASTGVLLFYVANLIGVPFLLFAFVTMDTAFLALLALFLVTNTNPNANRARDPYADTTADLLRDGVMLPDQRPYGRREKDDRNVVARLSDILEDEAARRPPSNHTPAWAINLARANEPPDAAESEEEP